MEPSQVLHQIVHMRKQGAVKFSYLVEPPEVVADSGLPTVVLSHSHGVFDFMVDQVCHGEGKHIYKLVNHANRSWF